MALFDNGDLEEFLLFVQNSNKGLEESGTMVTGAEIQYICTLVRGEALHQFESLSADTEGTNPLNVEDILSGLASYFFPLNFLVKQIRAMRRRMRNPHSLKFRYGAHLIDINE